MFSLTGRDELVEGKAETPEAVLRGARKRKLAATVRLQELRLANAEAVAELKEARAAEYEAAVAIDPDDPQVLRVDEPPWETSDELLADLGHGREQPRADVLAARARRESERLRAREEWIETAVRKRLGGLPSVMQGLSGDMLEEAERRYWERYNEWVARNGDPAERRRAEARGEPPDWVVRLRS